MLLSKISETLLGKRLDPFSGQTRQHIALVAFLAWVGLGADGLSSSCYGPEEAFLALGRHTHLGLYMALATAITVFVIAIAYNQVIELFPTGGGGYKVATNLIGPHAGLVSGSALIVDYMLTIAISVASGADALFSLLPLGIHPFKIGFECVLIALLVMLNLRGMREAIKVLLPRYNHSLNLTNPRRVPLSVQARQRAERDAMPATYHLKMHAFRTVRTLGWLCIVTGVGMTIWSNVR